MNQLETKEGIQLTRTIDKKVSGLSKKTFYQDKEQRQYMLKGVKARKAEGIFNNNLTGFLDNILEMLQDKVPDISLEVRELFERFYRNYPIGNFTQEEENTAIEELKLALREIYNTTKDSLDEEDNLDIVQVENLIFDQHSRLIHHVRETLVDFMHTEILGPLIAKALWGKSVIVPETFYPKNSDPSNPRVVTRFLDEDNRPGPNDTLFQQGFEEFIETKIHQYVYNKFHELYGSNPEQFNNLLQRLMDSGDVSIKFNGSFIKSEDINEFFDNFALDYFERLIFIPEKPSFWQNLDSKGIARPRLQDLNLNRLQKRYLGQLYAMALITSHYDILNNISGTNSGSMLGRPVCVDWGNSFAIGYSGLTKDEGVLSWKTGYTKTKEDSKENSEREFYFFSQFDDKTAIEIQQNLAESRGELTNHQYVMPYIGCVFPRLPRLLVEDMFDLNDPYIRCGMLDFIQIAARNSKQIDGAIEQAWKKAPKSIQDSLTHIWYEPGPNNMISEVTKDRIDQLAFITQNLDPDDVNYAQHFEESLIKDMQQSYLEITQLYVSDSQLGL